ncbi:MAG: Maf family protein [Acidobacteriota bacterium]|nr:Maf family protein [Acidobacteriota bacterium]
MKLGTRSPKLILASASPRRAELLRNAGIAFTAQATRIPERRRQGESPKKLAERLARQKARAIRATNPRRLVLGADTIVIVRGKVLGKPRDRSDARRMLRLLSGRSHQVTTAVCLAGPGFEDLRSETTRVTMRRLSEQEIRDYVASREPRDKAGAYAIQGIASRFVSRIEGCYFNLVGLPVPLVYRMLRAHHCL